MKEYKLKVSEKHWICTRNYKCDEEGSYEPVYTCKTLEDLIQYALTYGYNFEIPKGYKYTTIYSINFSTGNFDPKYRNYSNLHSTVIYSYYNKKEAEQKFSELTKSIDRNRARKLSKTLWCWHTEDYAYNQIIHSYSLSKSYIVERSNENE